MAQLLKKNRRSNKNQSSINIPLTKPCYSMVFEYIFIAQIVCEMELYIYTSLEYSYVSTQNSMIFAFKRTNFQAKKRGSRSSTFIDQPVRNRTDVQIFLSLFDNDYKPPI